jgi:hypothetical protein
MSRELAEVIAADEAFEPDEREIAALALGRVDDDEKSAVDASWGDEVEGRVEDILTGKVELVDDEETRRMVRTELAARRHA